jgi:YVTN family beta-propeller protein
LLGNAGHQTFASPQVDAIALSPTMSRLYVANTAVGTVNVIDTLSNAVVRTIRVGVDPVSLAVRPDGNELWVANHVSDSVSVIDTNPASATFHTVIETIQDLDAALVLAPVELEPLPPSHPLPGDQLATPYGIALSDDDSTLVATAAASSRIFSMDAATGAILDRLDVGAIPRGIALASNGGSGAPEVAYVHNTLDNSVAVVDVSNPSNLQLVGLIALPGDPTPEEVRLGRIAFNDADGSTTGTFSCASCHPDGHTDQLLWVIGATCDFAGCDQEELRSTMPIRGLRDTLPLHWDGVLGDPFGGTNGEVQTPLLGGGTQVPANCTDEQSCFRHLVDATLGGVRSGGLSNPHQRERP